jgi:hypothetical protein
VLAISNNVFANEKIVTEPASATELEFADGSRLSVGPAADVTLDRFVYDASAGTGQLALNIAKGTLRLATGRLQAPGHTLRTPTATIGIRGTILSVVVAANGLTTVIVEQGVVNVAGITAAAQTIAAGQATTVPPGGAASAPGAAPGDAVASVNDMDATLARAPGTAATEAKAPAWVASARSSSA